MIGNVILLKEMRRKRLSNSGLCCILVPSLGLLFVIVKYQLSQFGESSVKKFDTFNNEEMRNQIYPTKPRDQQIPTMSPAKLRELYLKRDARRAKDNQDIMELPNKPFGVESFDPDEKLQLEANALKPEDLNPIPKHSSNRVSVMPKLDGENVISMTLYGSTLKYTMGAIRNAELAKENFPGWKLRFYTETPSEKPKYGIVPQTVIDRLRVLGADVYYVEPEEDWLAPMMWRFLVADDISVDRFIVRDTDSRLTERDAVAVYEWVKSGKAFNCIRDHPSHAAYPVSGGMWGGRPNKLALILRHSWRELMRGVGKEYLDDMNFLNSRVWPKVQNHTYCSDSVSCDVYPHAYSFPVPRYGYEHVGQVVSEHELGRSVDINILKEVGENAKCVPKGFNRVGIKLT